MNVAQQYPARRDTRGVRWYRPRKDPGTTVSQWGWTANPRMAHPDYCAHVDAQTGGLHPEGLCGGDCSGCCSEGEGAGVRAPTSRCSCGLPVHGCTCAGEPACVEDCEECELNG